MAINLSIPLALLLAAPVAEVVDLAINLSYFDCQWVRPMVAEVVDLAINLSRGKGDSDVYK